MIRWKRSWEDLSEALPLDVMPCSNGEFYPPPPTKEQRAVMEIADREVERVRKKFNMNRRDFVRTTAAMAICFWARDVVIGGGGAQAHNTTTTDACDLEWEEEVGLFTLNNLPGEFVFDIQSHHVESDGMWRVTNPGFHAFFAGIWSQAGPITGARPGMRSGGNLDPGSSNFAVRGAGAGELDPIENLSRFHYMKELFLDSATTMTVLSAVPAAPDITQPLPIERAALTVQMVNELAGSQRTVMHAFAMPNRGSAGTIASSLGQEPVYMQREFEIMEERAVKYGSIIRGWKTYPAWGDIPYASGWFFDDELVGQRFIDHVRALSQKYPKLPPNIATHKGFALPAFDQRAASPRDIGPAASRNPDVNFIVYHSGFDGETVGPYGGDTADISTDGAKGDRRVSSADRMVDSLIKSLRENNWDATRFGTVPGVKWANVPNVFAEIGSTWRDVMGQIRRGEPVSSTPAAAIHLLGKLITYVGPKRIAWGTDSLWFGSPHSEIVGLRRVDYSHAPGLWDFYKLPYAIDGDADDPRVDTRNWVNYTPSSSNASLPGWPTDSKAHPERSIRNWIFGRSAAEVYRVDADAHMLDRGTHPLKCDEVQKIRDAYIVNQYTPKEQVPMASNTLIGARTASELKTERMNQPWAP
ncbi:MAG TPA: hypothetical protein VGB64_02420 [Actinomycetota bacterium]